ncbi:MAG TPA: carboxymuconolactone decarboxylase family protein [Steroidobacteraceae bacterium]
MRIAAKPWRQYRWYLRPFFWNQRRKYGQVLQSALLWGRSPRVFLGVALLYGALERRRSPLEPALRSLVTVCVSQLNACRFCVDINSAILEARTGSKSRSAALSQWRDSGAFSEREQAALGYAEVMTRGEFPVSEEVMRRLHSCFDDDALVELTALIAFQNLSSRFNSALEVPSQGFSA